MDSGTLASLLQSLPVYSTPDTVVLFIMKNGNFENVNQENSLPEI